MLINNENLNKLLNHLKQYLTVKRYEGEHEIYYVIPKFKTPVMLKQRKAPTVTGEYEMSLIGKPADVVALVEVIKDTVGVKIVRWWYY